MSTSAAPTKSEPLSDDEYSDYRQPSDIVITVDTGNSVCSTILVEGCSDDLDLSLNDEEGNNEKASEVGDEQEQAEPEAPTRPKRLRSKVVQSPPEDIKPVVVRKMRRGRKGRQERPERSERQEKPEKLEREVHPERMYPTRVVPTANVEKKALYLRSAVLSRDEITHEVLHRSKADIPKPREASLFTTKLMMRLASKLPPSRARPTCEELKDLMNSQRERGLGGIGEFPSYRSAGQGTPLRVKAERPSFCETLNHIMQVPTEDDSADFRSNMLFNITCSNIHCREEREQKIAMLQQQTMHEIEPVVEEVNTEDGLASLSIDSLQLALRDTNCPNRKEIEKQIALHQLETLRGRRGRPCGRPSLSSKDRR